MGYVPKDSKHGFVEEILRWFRFKYQSLGSVVSPWCAECCYLSCGGSRASCCSLVWGPAYSTLGDWTHWLRFMDCFGILISMLALNMWDSSSSLFTSVNFGLGSTTSGERQVIASPSGTFSKISSFTPWSSQSLIGFRRWHGTEHVFWAAGCVSGSISSLTSIFLPVLFSRKQPIPWNISLYSFSIAAMLPFGVLAVLIPSPLVL